MKIRQFLVAGVRLVWVVYLLRRQAEIWRPGDEVKPSVVLGMADWLDGYEVAPELSVPTSPLFRSSDHLPTPMQVEGSPVGKTSRAAPFISLSGTGISARQTPQEKSPCFSADWSMF